MTDKDDTLEELLAQVEGAGGDMVRIGGGPGSQGYGLAPREATDVDAWEESCLALHSGLKERYAEKLKSAAGKHRGRRPPVTLVRS